MLYEVITRVLRAHEDALDHRLERLERHRLEIRVEGTLVVEVTELRRRFEVGMAAILIAQVPVEPKERNNFV